MAAHWTVNQLAVHCDVSRSTIQKRADAYAWALSDDASPGKGEARRFTPRDVAIMIEVDRQAKAGILHDQIELGLKASIDARSFDDVDDFPAPDEDPAGTISVVEHERQMVRAETLVQRSLERADKADAELQKTREMIAELKGQIAEMRRSDRTQELTEEVIRLNREIARLEYQIEMLQKETG
jgi:hypothetical protein